MRQCVLLSFLLALLVGHNFPTPGVSSLPEADARTAELQPPPIGDHGIRLSSDNEESIASDAAPLSSTGKLGSLAAVVRLSPPQTSTTPYAIRAPPVSTTL